MKFLETLFRLLGRGPVYRAIVQTLRERIAQAEKQFAADLQTLEDQIELERLELERRLIERTTALLANHADSILG